MMTLEEAIFSMKVVVSFQNYVMAAKTTISPKNIEILLGWLTELRDLRAKHGRLVKALKFYADQNNYHAFENYRLGGYNDPAIVSDEGEKARKALADEEGV